jgi:hypothetical protein
MKAPLKLNRRWWPARAIRLLPSSEDPRTLLRPGASSAEFARAVSVLKFGPTFKTTSRGRQPIGNALVRELFAGRRPVILDIGASDGSTSVDLITALGDGFERYFVTDFNLVVQYAQESDGTVFFRARSGDVILASNDRFVAYADVGGAFPGFAWASRRLLARGRKAPRWTEMELVQPSLQQLRVRDPRISVEQYDIMQRWSGPTPDLIKIANVLNRAYFSEVQIAAALRCQCAHLKEGGWLLLIDNREEIERVSAFRREKRAMVLEHTHNGGAEAASQVPPTL